MNINNNFCGKIILLGKSNVGKSTLLNQIIGDTISIVSHKKNTTQTKTTGIKTKKNYQYIIFDTPGINTNNKYFNTCDLNKETKNTMKIADIILFILNPKNFTIEDQKILQNISKFNKPIIIVINKIDLIKNKKLLLPFIAFIKGKINNCNQIIPISAKNKSNINYLIQEIKTILPLSEHEYSSNINTQNSLKFTISEIIREKIIKNFQEEIPYVIKIKIESIDVQKNGNYSIKVLLIVNNNNQKKIIIGKKGQKIKILSTLSRKEIEKKLQKKIFLTIWVKINNIT
ncbi:GTPase Era [Buchnera aphidicola (Eriosoma grossulariae)]|uniref:GTPase Era n=1 Tax=Buchnera aphidicola TaxID=9 RepID=UPI00346449B3